MAILQKIDSPADLKRLSLADLTILAEEIRQLIIQVTAQKGGHLAPSLGVVELTIALHYVFDAPKDKIIWDVGHQSYAHKIITGRRKEFLTLRTKNGISGFPKREESIYDVFSTGHSGNSISVALGLADAAHFLGERVKTIAVIGDGSIVTGMAFEALNNTENRKRDLIVVLNDNEMSIAKTNGAIAAHLSRIITGQFYNRVRADVWNLLGKLPKNLGRRARIAAKKVKEGLKNLIVPSIIFEEMGFRYVGPIQGHSLSELITTFQKIKNQTEPVLVHIVTKKGKGYKPAETEPERFHSVGPFEINTGRLLTSNPSGFTKVFGESLVNLAARNQKIVVITPGMCLGSGLEEFRRRFPERFYDVGICEQHAVTFAAGLALGGLKPIVAIYSTFLCRAYDQLIQDVCLQKLPVVFAIDRAGLVGEDGPTHHGLFDLSYLRLIPNLVVMAPMDEMELVAMLEWAVRYDEGPVAIRYPRGGGTMPKADGERQKLEIRIGRAEIIREGKDGCVLAIGSAVLPVLEAAEKLTNEGIDLCVVNARFAKPLDKDLFLILGQRFKRFVTVEENVLAGGFGSAVRESFQMQGIERPVKSIGLPDNFIVQGRREELLAEQSLVGEKLIGELRKEFSTLDALPISR